jgi:hypothetical protein
MFTKLPNVPDDTLAVNDKRNAGISKAQEALPDTVRFACFAWFVT